MIKTVALNKGDEIPDFNHHDGLWVLGGPQQVWQESNYPWLVDEKQAIREAINSGFPYFGLCLGHQLLADSLGGEVGIASSPEVGLLEVELTEAGRNSPFFAGLDGPMCCIQGHAAEVKVAPSGFTVLARSDDCAIQAVSLGDSVLSMQFHAEFTLGMIDACLELPEYKNDFEAMLGSSGISQFIQRCNESAAILENAARILYTNWIQSIS